MSFYNNIFKCLIKSATKIPKNYIIIKIIKILIKIF